MWFKNLRLYRFTQPVDFDHESLNDALAQQPFRPCGSLDPMRYGWVPPLGRHGQEWVHSANGYHMICAKRQEKILPAAVINEHLEEKVADIKAQESRHVARKEKQDLKDEVIFSLLPKAFSKSSLDFAYIAPREGLIVVNAASAKKAEELLSALREALGSLSLIPVAPNTIPTQAMTHWLLHGDLPDDFTLGEECELRGGKDGRVVRFKNQDLSADEVLNHLNAGMYVNRLALTWKDAIHCIVDDQLAIKRVKFEDRILEQADEGNPETAAETFDADFVVMTTELSAFIGAMMQAFGGEDTSWQG
ncbi:recombination-associated protein RdgC [Marinimicrobium alkaliphilum]|uniref:recombination-associated protein RdgC n=1 Tax=Marinimicrobium alkaliphilum TaxID=2202654 RepID=UPI000DBAA986|nr:recombination-associated protein RdgC [Marinimicrobium alkaliphilum]